MTTSRFPVSHQAVSVLIVDDHPTVREGLSYRISSQPDMSICGTAADVREALRKIQELRPDVAIVDLSLKNSDGLELIKILRTQHREVRTVVLTMYDESVYADRCLRAGAMAFVNKEADPEEVLNAIRSVMAGHVHVSTEMTRLILGRSLNRGEADGDPVQSLTDRQLEIFRLIGRGRSAAQIAVDLHISGHTVETHRENIKRKLNVATVSELTRYAVLWDKENR